MANEVEILLKASDKASQSIKGVEGELKKLGGAGKTAEPGLKRAGQALGDLVGFAAKGAGVIAGAGLIIKKAFDLGEEGAAIIQTAESFDLLLEKVGAAPDLLEQLQRASKGTIDDMSLMSSTATLLAGTQGDLATALADSTPRLLEIAKAAQKLNPALGDTTFLYDSLARGIKRASPMILDNLGIIVKIEDANQKYADSIGKAVEKLTLEEQKMALLNAVMEAGDVMIDQVGGSTDSATDSFTRLETSLKNLTDTGKKKLVPFLADAAEGANLLLTGNEQLTLAFQEHAKGIVLTTENYEDYFAEIKRIDELTPFFTQHVEILNQAQYDARRIEDQLGDTRRENISILRDHGEVAAQSAEDQEEFNKKMRGMNHEVLVASRNLQSAKKSMLELIEGVDTSLDRTLGRFMEQIEFMQAGGGILQQQFETIKKNLDKNKITPAEAEELTKQLFIQVANLQVEMGEITAEEAAENIEETLGVSIEEAKKSMEEFQDTAKTDIESKIFFLLTLKGNSLAIRIAEKMFGLREFNVFTPEGRMPGGVIQPKEESITHRRQYGGPVSAGGAYIVGEGGPELFVPRSSGNVISNNKIASQPVIINQYINDASAAAMAFAEVQRIRHGRLNESMGAR